MTVFIEVIFYAKIKVEKDIERKKFDGLEKLKKKKFH